MKYWGRSLIVYLAIVTLLYGTSDVSEAGVRYRGDPSVWTPPDQGGDVGM